MATYNVMGDNFEILQEGFFSSSPTVMWRILKYTEYSFFVVVPFEYGDEEEIERIFDIEFTSYQYSRSVAMNEYYYVVEDTYQDTLAEVLERL